MVGTKSQQKKKTGTKNNQNLMHTEDGLLALIIQYLFSM